MSGHVITSREFYLNEIAQEEGKPTPFPTGSDDRVVDLKIITMHVYPPIPTRSNDWGAYYDGHEEGPQGWGATEQEAVRDLIDNYDAPGAA